VRVSARERIYYNWQYAWVTAGMFQLAMTPLVWNIWSSLLLTVFLQLPAYLFHQVEECYGNRFRTFMNGSSEGAGRLSHPLIFQAWCVCPASTLSSCQSLPC